MKSYRQGDVLLVEMAEKPAEALAPVARENGRVVLAHGEVTGHAHAIDETCAKLFEASGVEDRFLKISGNAAVELKHEEHGAITLKPGWYTVRRQREYSPEAIRRVAD